MRPDAAISMRWVWVAADGFHVIQGPHATLRLVQYLLDAGVDEDMLSMADAGFANTQGSNSQDITIGNVYRFESMYSHDGDLDARMEPSFAPVRIVQCGYVRSEL